MFCLGRRDRPTDGCLLNCALLKRRLQEHALATNKIGFSHSTIRAWETSAIFLGNTREYHIVFSTHEVRMRGLGRARGDRMSRRAPRVGPILGDRDRPIAIPSLFFAEHHGDLPRAAALRASPVLYACLTNVLGSPSNLQLAHRRLPSSVPPCSSCSLALVLFQLRCRPPRLLASLSWSQ